MFSIKHGGIASCIDKETGVELADLQRPGGIFRLGTEAVNKQITAGQMNGMPFWFIVRWRGMSELTSDVEIIPAYTGSLRMAYRLHILCGRRSSLTVTISRDKGSRMLCYDVECDRREFGSAEDGVPDLHYFLPLGYRCEAHRYDVPNGAILYQGTDMDRPAQRRL